MLVDEEHKIRRFNHMLTSDFHAIVDLARNPTWTLLLVGKRTRTWGYLEPGAHCGSWMWTPFNTHPHAAEFDLSLLRRKAKGLNK